LRDNGLSLFFLAIFLAALAGQAFAGWHDFNNDQLRHQSPAISFGRYVVSSEFGRAILENWQSEYLQFTLYIPGTVWLLQRGSPESKELDKAGTFLAGSVDHRPQLLQRAALRAPPGRALLPAVPG